MNTTTDLTPKTPLRLTAEVVILARVAAQSMAEAVVIIQHEMIKYGSMSALRVDLGFWDEDRPNGRSP